MGGMWKVFCRLWRVSMTIFFSGVTLGLPTTILPGVQNSAFDRAFVVVGFATGLKGILNALMGPVVGALSDVAGHRKLWLIGMLTLQALPFLAWSISAYWSGKASDAEVVWVYTLADAILGVSSPAMSICFAVVPQELGTEEDMITLGSAVLIFALSSGVGAGAVLGAMSGEDLWGWLGLSVTLLNVVLSQVLFPRRSALLAGSSGAHGRAALYDIWRLLRTNKALLWIALIVLLDFLAEQMLVSLLLLYLETRFHTSSLGLGAELALVGFSASVSLLIVVPCLQPLLGAGRLMQLALVANAVSVGLFAFVQSSWQAFLPPLGCLLGFAIFPAANAIASKTVSLPQQGAAQGILVGARTLSEGVSPVAFGWLFEATRGSNFPGAPFLVAAGCILAALGISFGVHVGDRGGADPHRSNSECAQLDFS